MDKLVKFEDSIELLDERERLAFQEWQESKTPHINPDKSAKLYSLFLNGNTCEDIQRLNPTITLGQIVHARLSSDWDLRRDTYLKGLLEKTEDRHRQVALESLNFISDLLATTNLRYGDKLKKYIQTNKEEDLGELAISLRQYKEMAELHQKLAGVEGQSRRLVSGEVTVTHRAEVPQATLAEEEDAGSVIDRLLNGGK
jgi:hypothetical protein